MSNTRKLVFDFRGEDETPDQPEPVVLELSDETDEDGHFKHHIQCQTEIDGLATLQFTAAMSQSGADRVVGMNNFLRRTILEAEWPKFEQAAKDLHLKVEDLTDISGKLLSAYVRRPTTQPSESSSGQPADGSKSKASSSSAA